MNPNIRRFLPAVIAIILGIIFLVTMRHVLPRQYYIFGCALFSFIPSVLWELRRLRVVVSSIHNQQKTSYFLTADSAIDEKEDRGIVLAFIIGYLYLIAHISCPPNERVSSSRLLLIILTNAYAVPFYLKMLLMFDTVYYHSNSLSPFFDGDPNNGVEKRQQIVTENEERDMLQVPVLCFFLSTICVIWFLSSQEMNGVSAMKSVLSGMYVLFSIVVISLLNSISLHHRVLLNSAFEDERGGEANILLDNYHRLMRRMRRVVFLLALFFLPTMLYITYVLLS